MVNYLNLELIFSLLGVQIPQIFGSIDQLLVNPTIMEFFYDILFSITNDTICQHEYFSHH